MSATDDRQDVERASRIRQNLALLEQHLRECVDLAGRGELAFFGADFINRYAAYAALIQAGNAVKDLPETFRAAHPSVRWRALSRVRDKVGHIYGEGVDWKTIWQALIVEIPKDLEAVAAIRATLSAI